MYARVGTSGGGNFYGLAQQLRKHALQLACDGSYCRLKLQAGERAAVVFDDGTKRR